MKKYFKLIFILIIIVFLIGCEDVNTKQIYKKKLSDDEKIYKEVDNVMMSRYELFFAHYELTEPIHCVDVSEERLKE